jgi:beta-N-acetylhexosaminidase
MRIPALLTALTLALTACTPGSGSGVDAQSGDGASKGAVSTVGPGADQPDRIGEVADFREPAAGIVAQMDDAALAGALVVGSYDGTDPELGAAMVRDNQLAGAIVMAYNLPEAPTAEDVRAVTHALAGAGGDRGWNVFLGVDQEGGPVSRLGAAALDLPPLMAHGAADDAALTTAVTQAQGADLRALGLTADFAPVADVTIGADDPAINVRSAGADPELVSRTVEAAIAGYTDAGIASSAKHFPGHGALDTDSHEALPVSDSSIADMAERDLVPFSAAVEEGVPMIMMGHIGLPGAETTPASLNPEAYSELRDRLDYDGVVVTDALNMGAVTAGASGAETVEAIRAGADLALLPPDATASVTALQEALGSGELPRERVVQAAERVVAMQLWQEHASGLSVTVDDAAERISSFAEESLTVLAGECSFPAPVEEIAVTGADSEDVAAFTEAAEAEGLQVDPDAGLSVGIDGGSGDVLVATDGPWRVADAGADTVLVAYDDYAAGFAAVARYLRGEAKAGGSMPVEVDGVEPPSCG